MLTGKIAQKTGQNRQEFDPRFVYNAIPHGEMPKNFDDFYEK